MALTISKLIEKTREELSKVTGLELGSTVGAAKEEEGWRVSVEMVEKHSLPDQMDILANYEALIDDEGNLISFNRKGLRKRIETEEILPE